MPAFLLGSLDYRATKAHSVPHHLIMGLIAIHMALCIVLCTVCNIKNFCVSFSIIAFVLFTFYLYNFVHLHVPS